MRPSRLAIPLLLLVTTPTMAIDLAPLWDFNRPDLSEQRFREALAQARGDDALILQTQIARTHGLRRDFDGARRVLREIEAPIATAGAEARVRWQLEWGRSFASGKHRPEEITAEASATARKAWDTALAISREAKLDGLAIDAIHMYAFIDTTPDDPRRWAEAALAISLASTQPDAQRWEASIRNNLGMALHGLGRLEEALAQFRSALALRERGTNAQTTHVARWMVAWTLRSLGRLDEALAIQLRLEREREREASGQPDPYVFDELASLYRAKGDADKAAEYAARKDALAAKNKKN